VQENTFSEDFLFLLEQIHFLLEQNLQNFLLEHFHKNKIRKSELFLVPLGQIHKITQKKVK
jgi:hypothetical protein